MASRTFFRDCQEWEWIPRRFDPARALAAAAQRRRADRHQPARDRRRGLGQAAVGRAQPRSPTTCPPTRRHLLPDGADPRDHTDLAVLRPAQRRNIPAAGRLRPLATRRSAHRRRLPRRARRGGRLPARRARPQDRHRVHQTCRSRCWGRPSRPGRRCARRSQPSWTARPASTSTCSSPSARTRSRRTTSTAPSSPRSASRPASRPPTCAATSPATGPAPRSPASSTTPRSR